MRRHIVPVFVALSALVAASCGGSESSPDASTAGADTTVPTENTAVADTADPAPPPTDVLPPPAPDPGTGASVLPDDTGPELQWTEVATEVRVPPGELMWTGSAFLIGSHDDTGLIVLRSIDGVDWQPLSNLPDGIDWFGIHAADESIVVWGTDPLAGNSAGDDGFEPPDPQDVPELSPQDVRIITSTDGGASWVELERLGSPGVASASPYVQADSSFYGAATSGDIVFVTVETFVQLDVERILTDNGGDPARLADARRTADGIAICLFPVGYDPADEVDEDDDGFEGDEGDDGFEGDEGDDDEGEAVPADEGFEDDEGDAVPADDGFDDEGFETCEGAEGAEGIEQLDVTFQQLGLEEADIPAIDTGSLETYRSLAGGPFEVATVDPPIRGDWYPGWLRVVDGEFVAAATNESGETLVVRSADALEWEHGDPVSGYIEGVTTDGVSLFARSYSDQGPVFIRSDDGGRTWTDFGLPGAASDEIVTLSAGPAGFLVLGALIPEPSVVEPRPFLIEKDGYGLRMTDDNETIVIDLGTGETVLYLGPEEDSSEFVIEDENGVTLLDEDTLEPLVRITWSELEQAFAQAFSERPEPELFLGWSADGEHWGWQFVTEAFGANGGAQFVVGDDAVVAMYQDFEASMSAVRMFTAQVG